MEVTREVHIQRPAEEVFTYLADIARMPEWQPGITSARKTSDGPTGAGSTFRVSGRSFAARSRIKTFEPPSRLVVDTEFNWGRGDIEYRLQSLDGGTLVMGTVRAELGLLARGLVPKQKILSVATEEIESSLRRLKTNLESHSG